MLFHLGPPVGWIHLIIQLLPICASIKVFTRGMLFACGDSGKSLKLKKVV